MTLLSAIDRCMDLLPAADFPLAASLTQQLAEAGHLKLDDYPTTPSTCADAAGNGCPSPLVCSDPRDATARGPQSNGPSLADATPQPEGSTEPAAKPAAASIATHQPQPNHGNGYRAAHDATLIPTLLQSVPQHEDHHAHHGNSGNQQHPSHAEMLLLPGFDVTTDPQDAAYLADIERRQIEAAMSTTRSIDAAAGEMERRSPLFAALAPNLFNTPNTEETCN